MVILQDKYFTQFFSVAVFRDILLQLHVLPEHRNFLNKDISQGSVATCVR